MLVIYLFDAVVNFTRGTSCCCFAVVILILLDHVNLSVQGMTMAVCCTLNM